MAQYVASRQRLGLEQQLAAVDISGILQRRQKHVEHGNQDDQHHDEQNTVEYNSARPSTLHDRRFLITLFAHK